MAPDYARYATNITFSVEHGMMPSRRRSIELFRRSSSRDVLAAAVLDLVGLNSLTGFLGFFPSAEERIPTSGKMIDRIAIRVN